MKHELPRNGLRSDFGDFWNFLIFWIFGTFLRNTFNLGARKRKNFLEHGTWTKRFLNICSFDQYKLGLKRLVRFCAMLSQSGQHETFFENSRFWRFPLGFGRLAPGASVLLYKHLAKKGKEMLYDLLFFEQGLSPTSCSSSHYSVSLVKAEERGSTSQF